MLSWNAVLGVFGDERLCLHEDLTAHVDEHDACSGTAAAELGHAEADHCPPCVDLELRFVELRMDRPTNPVLPDIEATTTSDFIVRSLKFDANRQTLTRVSKGPPKARTDSVLIAQTIVLHL